MCNGHLFHKCTNWSVPKEVSYIMTTYASPILGGYKLNERKITRIQQERTCLRCGKYEEVLTEHK